MEKSKRNKRGYLGAQDTFYVGTLKGVGRIYQQTFIDTDISRCARRWRTRVLTYTKVAHVKLYDRKNALVAADALNDKVVPWFEAIRCATVENLD